MALQAGTCETSPQFWSRMNLIQVHRSPNMQVVITVVPLKQSIVTIDDSTPVSQSRHPLRFQPIVCRSIMRCPHVLTRPEMAWQAFVPDTASGQLAVFDMAEKKPGKRNCCFGQCKSDERYPDKCAGVTS